MKRVVQRRPLASFTLTAALALGAAACADSDELAVADQASVARASAAHVAGEVLIQYAAGATSVDKASARSRAGAVRAEVVHASARGELELARIPAGTSVGEAIARLERDANVVFAEPNYVYTHSATTTNDPSLGQLWGLHNTGQSINGNAGGTPDVDVDAPEAWDLSRGSTTVWVGVIDEGIDHRHPDLAGVVVNPGEDANNDGAITSADYDGIDSDGNGFVDDVHGWDFVNGDNSVYDGKSAKDTNTDAHGTHVTGTIGAVGNNGTGIVGVNWNVRVISGKFLGRSGGTTANAIKAVDYMTDFRVNRGVNLVVTNNSWGGGGFSQGLFDAIERANAAGVLFAAAAGNGGNDGVGDDTDSSPHYPSSYTNANVISVAAIDRFDQLTAWSNFGATSVDVGAPGATILSTTPNNTYAYYSGTSMATPHVAGLVALLEASAPTLSGADLKSRVLGTVVQTAALAGKCVTGGRINAYRALANTTTTDPK